MAYIISGEDELAGAPVAREADDVAGALKLARQMRDARLVNLKIDDTRGNEIGGEALLACVEGEMTLLPDLTAELGAG